MRRVTDRMAAFRAKREEGEPHECWMWTAATCQGYGWFYRGRGLGAGFAHRWIYEQLVGPVPADMDVHHLCGEIRCVNPRHLATVSHVRHTRIHNRKERKVFWRNTLKTHCHRGHPLSEDNTYRYEGGGRACKECKKINRRRLAERQGAAS